MTHYVYKIVNKFTGEYYIGVHSTDNLNDGYMGSGIALKEEYKIYGLSYFKKEILHYCKTRAEALKIESDLVNPSTISDINCLNLTSGGGGYPMMRHEFAPNLGSIKKKDRTDPNFFYKIHIDHQQLLKDFEIAKANNHRIAIFILNRWQELMFYVSYWLNFQPTFEKWIRATSKNSWPDLKNGNIIRGRNWMLKRHPWSSLETVNLQR